MSQRLFLSMGQKEEARQGLGGQRRGHVEWGGEPPSSCPAWGAGRSWGRLVKLIWVQNSNQNSVRLCSPVSKGVVCSQSHLPVLVHCFQFV